MPAYYTKTAGVSAEAPADLEAIVSHVAAVAQSGDVVLVMSNGGFGGIHGKLLKALGAKSELQS